MKIGFLADTALAPDVDTRTRLKSDWLIGLGVAAIAPAAFWTGLAYWISAAFGATLSLNTLLIIALVIAGFLTLIYRAVALSSS